MRLGSTRRSQVAPGLVLPYPTLENAGLRLRRGQTSLWVAAPGVGKSQLLTNICYRMRVPTVYWSADTDQTEVTIRLFAMHLGMKTDEVEAKLGDDAWRGWMQDRFTGAADHIDWVFDSPITGRLLGERMKAFAEKHGEYPHMCVLDNMSNAIQNPADEYAEIKTMQTQVQQLAREINCHIGILHHAKGEYDSGAKPIPQSGGLQNPFKIPEVGVTMYRPDADSRLAVNVVKNRGGKSDPSASNPASLPINFDTATVQGFRP